MKLKSTQKRCSSHQCPERGYCARHKQHIQDVLKGRPYHKTSVNYYLFRVAGMCTYFLQADKFEID